MSDAEGSSLPSALPKVRTGFDAAFSKLNPGDVECPGGSLPTALPQGPNRVLPPLLPRRRGQVLEAAGERVLHVDAVDDEVDHPVLEQELAALEAVGELLPDGLLDHARPGEADQRL